MFPRLYASANSPALLGALFSISVLALGGCSHVGTASRERSPELRAAEEQAQRIENKYTKKVHFDRELSIYATVWNPTVRRAELLRAPKSDPQQRAAIEARIARWDRAIAGSSAYILVLELRNQPGEASIENPRLDLHKWGFALQRPGQAAKVAQKVEVIQRDRFPTEGDDIHWRIGLLLSFAETRPFQGSAELQISVPPPARENSELQLNFGPQLARMSFQAVHRNPTLAP